MYRMMDESQCKLLIKTKAIELVPIGYTLHSRQNGFPFMMSEVEIRVPKISKILQAAQIFSLGYHLLDDRSTNSIVLIKPDYSPYIFTGIGM